MRLPKILLIGQNGQVGWELNRSLGPLGDLRPVDFPALDLRHGDLIRRWVRDVAPDVVVNAAAYTSVDQAEAEPDLAMRINGIAPGVLAEECRKIGALLVHYSTDYVFDGTKSCPFVEEDPACPLNVYGRTKLAGDEAIRAAGCPHLIFRLCWVYGSRGQNFMLTIMRLAREREKLRVVCDQTGSPTWSRMIAEATASALKQVWVGGDPNLFTGTYHLSASGSVSWHGFAERIVALMPESGRRCRQVEAIPTAEYPTPARRPANSVLSCGKLLRTFGLRLPHWEESLKLVLEEAGQPETRLHSSP